MLVWNAATQNTRMLRSSNKEAMETYWPSLRYPGNREGEFLGG